MNDCKVWIVLNKFKWSLLIMPQITILCTNFIIKKKTTRTMKLWNNEINDKMKIWAWKYETQIGKKMIRWLFKLLM